MSRIVDGEPELGAAQEGGCHGDQDEHGKRMEM